ncbi:Outer dense fiber protein 2-like [Oopsacas minuta]|uniref:Outer dense fiber protein 2-like n=1 Tax=Oopsacas minuta TaxID=111878 RepID=A0AAV7K7A0_9METZ|nr:Outer dense fiber protein 2-like [Oopsacas minuta]
MDPLHVHVGKDTPIHLHVTDAKKKLSAKAAKISKSFSEMSAGRPSLRAQESLNKPTRLTWNSPTHTLQIQTPNRFSIRTPDGAGPSLELSELTGSGGVKGKTTELILETPETGGTHEQLIDAKNRIKELESEVELERTIRRVEEREKLGGDLSGLDLANTSYRTKQDSNLIRQQTRDGLDSIRYLQDSREGILRKLLETELLSADSSKLSDKLRRIVQRVEREKSSNG